MTMNVIKVKPDDQGRIIIKLFGTEYQIVVDLPEEELQEDEESDDSVD